LYSPTALSSQRSKVGATANHHGILLRAASILKLCLTIFMIALTSLQPAFNGNFTQR
jgi:hypothetical protein